MSVEKDLLDELDKLDNADDISRFISMVMTLDCSFSTKIRMVETAAAKSKSFTGAINMRSLVKDYSNVVGWSYIKSFDNSEKFRKIDYSAKVTSENIQLVITEIYDIISNAISHVDDGVLIISLSETILVNVGNGVKFMASPSLSIGSFVLRNGTINDLWNRLYTCLSSELNKSDGYDDEESVYYISNIALYHYFIPSGSKGIDDNCFFHSLNVYEKASIESLRSYINVSSGPVPIDGAVHVLKLLNSNSKIVTTRREGLYGDILLKDGHYSLITHGWKRPTIMQESFANRIICHYDVETTTMNVNSFHEVSIIGYIICDSEGKVIKSFNSCVTFKEMIDDCVGLSRDMSRCVVYLNAYNGRNFDHYHLIREMINKIIIKKYITKGLQILRAEFEYKSVLFSTYDLNKIIKGSLESNAISLLGVKKEEFTNYRSIDKYENMDHSSRERLIKYLRKDVLILKLLYDSMYNCFRKLNINISCYISLSQITYEKYMRESKYSCKIFIPPSKVDSHFRAACYGGRSHPVRRYFESQNSEDVLVALDVNSLYPSALCMDMPLGVPGVFTYKDIDIIDNIEKGHTLAICYASTVACKCTVLEPIIPRHENGKIKWDFKNGEGWYTSIALRLARSYGYKVTILNGYYWREKAPIFKEHVESMYSFKRVEKRDSAMYLMYKELLNSFYGKLLQRPVAEEIICCSDSASLTRVIEKYGNNFSGIARCEIGNKIFMKIKHERKNWCVTKPSHLGAFTLDYSKVIMFDHMERLHCLRDEAKLLYYTNTDSIYVHKSQVGIKMNDLLNGLKNEYESDITRAIFISPKMYYLKLSDGREIMHMKGIDTKKCNVTEGHYTKLYNGEIIKLVVPFEMRKSMITATSNDCFNIEHKENVIRRINPRAWIERRLQGNVYEPLRF